MAFPRLTRASREQKALLGPANLDGPIPAIYGPPVSRRLSQREAPRHLQAYGGSEAVDWVRDAVDVYLAAAASAQWHLEAKGKRLKLSTDDSEGDYTRKAPTDLEGLLRRPNPWWTFYDLIDHLLIDLLLVGNAYWFKYRPDADGKPAALYRLAPPLVEAVPGERKIVEQYLYKVPGTSEPLKIDPKDLIHFKLPNPHDPVYGLGIIAGSTRVYDIELGLVESMAQYYERGTKLSGVLQSDRSVPEPIFKRIQRQFQSMYSGSRNAYQVAVLERGLSFQSIQSTAAEAQFVELTKLGRDRVFNMFRVHPSLVDGAAAKEGVLDEAQRYFDERVMRPALNKLEERISHELTQAWGADFKFDFEYVLPEQARLDLAASFGGLPGVKVKEVREYLKLEPLGDERDEIVLNLPGITTEDGGIADRQPGPQGGRPANPNNTAAIDRGVPSGGAAVTKPDPAAQARLRKALYGPPEALDELIAEVTPALPERGAPEGLLASVRGVLLQGEQMTKAQRVGLVEAVEKLPELGDAPELRAELVAHVAEGVRRGYSPAQLDAGWPAERYPSIQEVIDGHARP